MTAICIRLGGVQVRPCCEPWPTAEVSRPGETSDHLNDTIIMNILSLNHYIHVNYYYYCYKYVIFIWKTINDQNLNIISYLLFHTVFVNIFCFPIYILYKVLVNFTFAPLKKYKDICITTDTMCSYMKCIPIG